MNTPIARAEGLRRQSYDLASRYLIIGRVLAGVALESGPILDVGGAEGLLRSVVPDRPIVTLDVRPIDVDVVASGEALPFRSEAFAAAVAADVLEHVPAGLRAGMIREMARVANVVVLAGPYDDPLIRAAEDRQRDRFKALFGAEHNWLAEHKQEGLPSLRETMQPLEREGFSVASFGSNPLAVWEAELEHSYTALRVGLDPHDLPVRNQLIESFLPIADRTPPSYREFVVALRGGEDLEASLERLAPGTDHDAVARMARRIELSTREIIGRGFDEARGVLGKGWSETAETVRELTEVIHSAPAEQTVEALERLVNQTRAWHELIAGPDVSCSAEVDTMPDVTVYDERVRNQKVPPPPNGPLISVVVPVFDPQAEHLVDCIRSVRAQSYPHWELVLVNASNAAHVEPICRRFAELDARVRVVRVDNLGIAGNTNVGVGHSTSDWIAFLDHDDVLAPQALASAVDRIHSDPTVEFLYSDEDKLDDQGRYSSPFFKPDYSPDLLRTINYIGHLVVVRRQLVDAVGGMRPGFEGAQDFDFVLRATDAAKVVGHVPAVLYHWRQHPTSTASDVNAKPEAHAAGRRALQDHLRAVHPGAWVEPGPGATAHRSRYPLRLEKISVIIPFRDESHLTDACLAAIDRCGANLPLEVLLVSNRSREQKTLEMMDEWSTRYGWVRILDYDEPFNFHQLNNWAVRRSTGSLLLFLNNDTEPIHAGWIEALAEHAQRREVGAVGARLFYPDGRVQHAGVAVGIGGFAEHPWAGLHPDAATPAGPSYWTRNMLAVTAACLMVERAKFDEVGGFDERFQVCGGDVDLCIRLHEARYRNVFTPFARLIHHESATRERLAPENDVRESCRAYAKYLTAGDPYFNRNLSLHDTSCRLAPD